MTSQPEDESPPPPPPPPTTDSPATPPKPFDLEELRRHNEDMIKQKERDFILVDEVEWANDVPDSQMVGEMMRRPRSDPMGDQCSCIPIRSDDSEDGHVEICCLDGDCELYACMEECGPSCPTGQYCGNKRLQNKQWKPLKLFETEKKGLGLKVLEDTKKGDLLTEYVGRAIPKSYVNRLFRTYRNERKLYIMSLDNTTYLDARHKGGIARYINHSCEPNCLVEKWKVRGINRNAIVAKTDIAAGTELSFDYQWELRRGRAPTKCHCGAPTCRGTLELPKSLEEEQLEASLSAHWKKPFLQQPGKEIINRSIQIFSKETQQYFWGDVTQYNPDNRMHLVMYRHDHEEVWEDLKNEDWMILDEQAEQFIISKKIKAAPTLTKSLLTASNLTGNLPNKTHIFVQTPIKEKFDELNVIDDCRRKCQVTISVTQMCKPPLGPTTPEEVEKFKALEQSTDGSVWKVLVFGSDVIRAMNILTKTQEYWAEWFQKAEKEQSNGIAKNPADSLAAGDKGDGSTGQRKFTAELIMPRSIVADVNLRMPAIRDRCRNVSIAFAPSESKSKLIARLLVEATLLSDLDMAKEHLWTQVLHCCGEKKTPKTAHNIYKDLGFLGGSLTHSQLDLLMGSGSSHTSGGGNGLKQVRDRRAQGVSEDLKSKAPFFASFETTQRCSIWVQVPSDKGRIDTANRRVAESDPLGPRKVYFGCDPKEVPKIWTLISTRAAELSRGVRYLHLGADRIYQPYMMRNGGAFFDLVHKVTGASVSVDSMTGDHLRVDGKGAERPVVIDGDNAVDSMSEQDRASLAEELIRLQVETYRDHGIRKHAWMFGRDWTLAHQAPTKSSGSPSQANDGHAVPNHSSVAPSPSMQQGSPFDGRVVSNACVEIADIVDTLDHKPTVAVHAVIIFYRYLSVTKQTIEQRSALRIKDFELACLFIANKSQKLVRWKTLEQVLEAAYAIFYPGSLFDSAKEEVSVLAERVVAAEKEILATLDYDVFWKGLDWMVDAAASPNANIANEKTAKSALRFVCSSPILASGPAVWLKHGAEYVFAAALAFMQVNLENMFLVLRLVPVKVHQVAETIAAFVNTTAFISKKSPVHQQLRDASARKQLSNMLPMISNICFDCMTRGITGAIGGPVRSTQAEMRYWVTSTRARKRRAFLGLPRDLVKSCIIPEMDGVIAESGCNIMVEKNPDGVSEDIVLEGSWRSLAIAEHLLQETVKRRQGHGLSDARDAESNGPNDTIMQSKLWAGLLCMEDIGTSDGWLGTVQSSLVDDQSWGRKTGGKCALPAKVAEQHLRNVGMRWWIPPRLGQSSSGSICDMFLVRTANGQEFDALSEISNAFASTSTDLPTLNKLGKGTSKPKERHMAVSLQRWPPEKMSKRELAFLKERGRPKKDAARVQPRKNDSVQQMGFSSYALQEMQLLNSLHKLIRSPCGHPNFVLPVAIADAASKNDNNDSNPSAKHAGKDISRSIEEDIFSLTRTSEENELAAQKERRRKDMLSGPHLLFQPSPFILQKFMARKKPCDSAVGDVGGGDGGGNERKHLSPVILVSWFHDLISALAHCHSNNVLLRNLASDQIVVDHSGVVKIANLYRSTVCSDEDAHADPVKLCENDKERHRKIKKSRSGEDKGPMSSPYEAPEMLLGSPKHTMETDVWAMGCLLAHLLLRRPPFTHRDRESMMRAICKVAGTPSKKQFRDLTRFPYYGQIKGEKKYKRNIERMFHMDENDRRTYQGAIDLISEMLKMDPKERISASQALNHPYMAEFVSNSDSTLFRRHFVEDWMSLKGSVMGDAKRKDDEMREHEKGIKRKAMLLAATSAAPSEVGTDDLYNVDDILNITSSFPKKRKS